MKLQGYKVGLLADGEIKEYYFFGLSRDLAGQSASKYAYEDGVLKVRLK